MRIAESGIQSGLVLAHVVMPSMSGREVVRKLMAKHPQLRVRYMSGYTDDIITNGGVLEAGLAFLQKPFTPGALAQKVREALEATAPVPKYHRLFVCFHLQLYRKKHLRFLHRA